MLIGQYSKMTVNGVLPMCGFESVVIQQYNGRCYAWPMYSQLLLAKETPTRSQPNSANQGYCSVNHF